MTIEEQQALDDVADRLGQLYQWVGQLDSDETLLDEVYSLTKEVERISDRVRRSRPDGSIR